MKQWIRERWKEMRWGAGIYLSLGVTFFNLILLISIRFQVYGSDFLWLVVLLFAGLSSFAVVIGHLHRIWQQDTDARLEYKAVIEDTVKKVMEEMDKREKRK